MAQNFPKRLVDCVVVMGADEHSGLTEVNRKFVDPVELSLEKVYKPHILGVISEQSAIYPYHLLQINPVYPPSQFSKKSQTRRLLDSQFSSIDESSHITQRRLTNSINYLRSKRISSTEFKIIQRRNTLFHRDSSDQTDKERNLPINNNAQIKSETIEGLPMFCYPDHLVTSDVKLNADIRYYVLTNIQGSRLYAAGLVTYREFDALIENETSFTQLKEAGSYKEQGLHPSTYKTLYVPITIILISSAPFFTLLKDLLSSLHKEISITSSQIEETIEFFAATLTHTPIAFLPGITLEINLFNNRFTLPSILSLEDGIVDFDVSLLFRLLDIDDIIYLVVSIILQKKIVIFSSNSVMATLACETLLLLIQPFKWNFPCIPFLPPNLLEVLHAPQPYIMGCHSCLLSAVIEDTEINKDIIAVKLDNSSINRLAESSPSSPPTACINQLKESIQNLKKDFDVYSLNRCLQPSPEAQISYRKRFIQINNEIILNAFYEFIVNMFMNVRKYIHTSAVDHKISFNSISFLNAQNESKQFYTEVIKSEIFDGLLSENLRFSSDKWFATEDRLNQSKKWASAQEVQQNFLQKIADKFNVRIEYYPNRSYQQEWYDAIMDSTPTSSDIVLPHASSDVEENFFKICLMTLEGLLDGECHLEKQSACLKLKCDIYVAQNQPIMALKELYRLSVVDVKLLDKRDVLDIMRTLSKTDYNDCCNEEFLLNLKQIANFSQVTNENDNTTRVERTFEIPNKPLSNLEFGELLKTGCITSERETQDILFEFFTMKSKDDVSMRSVDSEIFRLFYNQWIHFVEEIQENVSDLELNENEIVLKLSNRLTRIDPEGNGYLMATQERLLFLPGGGKSARHLCWFSDILEIKKNLEKFHIFRRSVKTLTIDYKRRKMNPGGTLDVRKLVLWLNEDCSPWFTLLNEIWSSRLLAKEFRDSTIVKKGIDHFFILDTLFACFTRNIHPFFHENMKKGKAMLSTFTEMKSNNCKLSYSTQKFLRYRFDADLPANRSIEALLFISKNCSMKYKMSLLLCLCSSTECNKLIVISTDMDYRPLKEVFQTQDKLICMAHSKVSSTIWVGSLDRKIYLVDVDQMTLKRELIGHSQSVLCIEPVDSHQLVLSGSYYGEVIGWNAITHEVIWKIEAQPNLGDVFNLVVNSDYFICNTHRALTFHQLSDREMISSFKPEGLSANMMISNIAKVNDFLFLTAHKTGILLIYDISNVQSPSIIQKVILNELQPACHHIKNCSDCVLALTAYKQCPGAVNNRITEAQCRGISKLVAVSDYLWICCKDGNIFIFSLEHSSVIYILQGHCDGVQAISWNEDKNFPLVYTGGRMEDGKIAAWNGKDQSQMERFEAQLL